ncbi:hypothetical protein [Cupriavidus sp. UME77]|uniref:hypothetical protein n=1 Tax=Cupriavidus sp. UME77 TaxID=1862321 RepID=UPI0015FFC7DB|nr:hypothetical protein [Cupriavidus sp. UME77]
MTSWLLLCWLVVFLAALVFAPKVPYDGLVVAYFIGVGFCTQGPYDIPLRGLPVTFL